jgi:hypothetical protein
MLRAWLRVRAWLHAGALLPSACAWCRWVPAYWVPALHRGVAAGCGAKKEWGAAEKTPPT